MPSPRIPRIPALKLSVSPLVERQFRALAREAFPKEVLSFLLGHDLGSRMEITDLWTPPPELVQQTDNSIHLADHLEWEAAEAAKDEGLKLLGDIHTHPWTKDQVHWRSRVVRVSSPIQPSACDWEGRMGYRWLTGICLVEEGPSGRLRCQFRYWGPLTPVELV